MQTVKLTKRYNANPKGAVVEVTNNVAHGLIEAGMAKPYSHRQVKPVQQPEKGYQTTSMRAGKAKKYNTK